MTRILPPAGPPRVLAVAQLANSVGDGAFYATSALFFTRVVGLSPTRVGLALTVGVGRRHARRRAARPPRRPLGATPHHGRARAGHRDRARGLPPVRSYPMFLLVACLYAICQGGLAAARQALLAGLVDPAQRTAVRASLQATLNAGLAVGAGLGALALTVDTAPAYLGVFALDSAAFLAAAVVLRRLPEVTRRPSRRRPPARAWPCCGTGRTPC